MSRWFGIGFLTFLLASAPALGANPPVGSIGLYLDGIHTAHEFWNPGGVRELTLYAFCRPSANGMTAAEFAISYPPNIIPDTILYGPDVVVYLGDPSEGISLVFTGCEFDWTLAFSQTVYLLDAAQSRIEIVPHSASNAIQFANCLEGFPVEAAGISSAVCLNTSCGPDTVPPFIVEAEATALNRVKVTFNEPLLEAPAEDVANYKVFSFSNPFDTIGVGSVVLEPGGRSVDVELLAYLKNRFQYTLLASGIQDTSGNVIAEASEVTFLGFDTEPPEIISATSPMDSVVVVTFNEPVTAASAEDTANYWTAPVGSTSPRYRPFEAHRMSEVSVTLLFAAPLPSPKNYTLHVSGVRDLAGNAIAPQSSFNFPVPDRTPPRLVSVTVKSRTVLDVLFSERVLGSTATLAGNYTAVLSSNPAATVHPQTASLITANTAELTFARGLAADSPYSLVVSGIRDLAQNLIRSGSSISFVCPDVYPPALLGAAARSPVLIDLLFDEKLETGSAELSSHYSVWETGHTSNTVPVGAARLLPDSASVRLTLGGSLPYDISYTVQAVQIKDRRGNTLASATATTLYPDTIPPAIASGEILDATTVRLAWSEKVTKSSAELASNYLIFETADSLATVSAALAVLSSDGRTVALDLEKPLISGRYYTLSVSGVSDLKANVIPADSRFAFPSPYIDDVPPRLLHATALGSSLVAAGFSEVLGPVSATSPSSYSIVESEDTLHAVPVAAASLASDSATVELSLGDTLTTGVAYILRVSGVADRAGNTIAPGAEKMFLAGVAPPLLWNSVATIDAANIVLTMNALVSDATARDTADYDLSCAPYAAPAVVSASRLVDGRSILLRLGSSMTLWRRYQLAVHGIEDLSGIAMAPAEKEFYCSPLPTRGSVGLFVDGERSQNVVYAAQGQITEFTMYVWAHPGQGGVAGAELAIRYPANVTPGPVEPNNEVVAFSDGDLASGCNTTFAGCSFEWTWTHKQTCYLLDTEKSVIGAVKAPGASAITFARCAEGFPPEQADVLTHLYCNCSFLPGTRLKTFSAECGDGCVEVAWSLSEIDEGIEFFIERAHGGEEEFTSISSDAIVRSGLAFAYRDRDVAPGETYRYRVGFGDVEGMHLLFETEPVAVPALPLALEQNRPNPFNPSTVISFYLPEECAVRLEVFETSGRLVARLVAGERLPAGPHHMEWNGRDSGGAAMSSGVYFYRLTAGRETLSRKMVLLR